MNVLSATAHRPYPLPKRPWRMTLRWNDLLFAHWPVAPQTIAPLIPSGLILDTYDNAAWIGVVPFFMDNVRTCTIGPRRIAIPTTSAFCELNLRTYVHSPISGLSGVYFFSLDAESALAVLGARTLFHLPYFWANMHRTIASDETIHYTSKRLLPEPGIRFDAHYRGLGHPTATDTPGTLEYFLTARYCLFTRYAGRILVGHIHHLPWLLEPAETEIRIDQLPSAHGITLPQRKPLLHFSRRLDAYIWSLEPDKPVR